uniref:Uncharacterized protein n=1 Tax=Anguilla anguilla TaxID=7936 RepID=A0A0E9WRA5_ANGAN
MPGNQLICSCFCYLCCYFSFFLHFLPHCSNFLCLRSLPYLWSQCLFVVSFVFITCLCTPYLIGLVSVYLRSVAGCGLVIIPCISASLSVYSPSVQTSYSPFSFIKHHGEEDTVMWEREWPTGHPPPTSVNYLKQGQARSVNN